MRALTNPSTQSLTGELCEANIALLESYAGTDGKPHQRPGALQVVFCDLGVPGGANAMSVYEKLRDTLVDAGMDVARLNFSHGTPEEHRRRMETIRAVEAETGRPIAVLIDLQGTIFQANNFAAEVLGQQQIFAGVCVLELLAELKNRDSRETPLFQGRPDPIPGVPGPTRLRAP